MTAAATAFKTVMHRDEPPDADVERRVLPGLCATPEAAIGYAREAGDASGWRLWSATVDEVRAVRRQIEPGVWATAIEDVPDGCRWRVGPGWTQEG